MVAQGKSNLQAPWLGISAFTVLALMLSLLVFIGEAARDAFNQENKAQRLRYFKTIRKFSVVRLFSAQSITSVSASLRVKHWRWLAKVAPASGSLTSILRLLPYPLARHPSGKIMYQGEDLLAATRYLRNVRGNHNAISFPRADELAQSAAHYRKADQWNS